MDNRLHLALKESTIATLPFVDCLKDMTMIEIQFREEGIG